MRCSKLCPHARSTAPNCAPSSAVSSKSSSASTRSLGHAAKEAASSDPASRRMMLRPTDPRNLSAFAKSSGSSGIQSVGDRSNCSSA
eukprot:123873-Rhodomonas_salina.3